MAERERDAERALVLGVRALHGLAWKVYPSVAGIPDRVVLLPGGRTVWCELKAPGGRLREIQKVTISRMRALGHEVVVLTGKEEVKTWLATAKEGTTT